MAATGDSSYTRRHAAKVANPTVAYRNAQDHRPTVSAGR